MNNLLLVIIVFGVLLISGAPVVLAMAFPAIIYFIIEGIPLSSIIYQFYNQLNSFSQVAIPMFILMGSLVNECGYTDKVFYLLKRLMKGKRGYSARVNVLISLIFAGISGVAIADIGGLGQMEVKAMEDEGYSREYAASLTIATASVGPVFPPSVPLVLYAMMAQVSSVRCLMAGIVPGLLMTLVLWVFVCLMDKRYLRTQPAHAKVAYNQEKTIGQAVKESLPILIAAPAIVLCMMFGVFSPGETGALSVFYFLVVGMIQRTLNWKKLFKCVKDTFVMCAGIFVVTAAGGLFSQVMALENLPNAIASLIFHITGNPVIILLLINLVLLILGCFMTSTAALVLVVPIILPITGALGIDPVHVGVFLTLNLMMGLLTPPFGLSVYTVAKVVDVTPEAVFKHVVPLYIPLMLSLLLVTFVPQISLWLPQLLFG